MGLAEAFAEKVRMQFYQARELIPLAASRYFTQVGRNLAHRVQHGKGRQRIVDAFAVVFAAYHRYVERYVLAYGKTGLGHGARKFVQNVRKLHTFPFGPLGRYAVDFFRFERYVVTFGLDYEIFRLDKFAHRPVKLPRELDHARPVIGVGNWGVVIAGKSCGLGIEYKVHACIV